MVCPVGNGAGLTTEDWGWDDSTGIDNETLGNVEGRQYYSQPIKSLGSARYFFIEEKRFQAVIAIALEPN